MPVPLAEHADRVRFVDHQPGVVFFAEFHDLGQVDDVAVHAEDRVGDDQFGDIGRRILEQAFEMLHVVVTEAAEFCARHQTAVHDGGVVDLVGEDVIAASH
jgi:hypothetical protein